MRPNEQDVKRMSEMDAEERVAYLLAKASATKTAKLSDMRSIFDAAFGIA